MIRILLGFCFCTLLATFIVQDKGNQSYTATTAPTRPVSSADTLLRELIIELPEDGGAWWVTVCLPEDHLADSRSRWLLAALAVEPRLRSLQAQCKNHRFTSNDLMFQAKWSGYVGELPALLVQMPDGKTCYKVSGNNLPEQPELLADEIARSIANCRPCPRPAPSPAPLPAPAPRPKPLAPNSIPDIRPSSAPLADRSKSALPVLLAGLAGAAAGGISEWRRSNKV